MKAAFSSSLDTTSKVITSLLCLFALGLIFLPFPSNDLLVNPGGAWTGFALLVLISCFFFTSPKSYQVSPDQLQIKRIIGAVRIKKEEVQHIRIPQAVEMKWPMRTFGNGGLFGYTGYYRTGAIGSMVWYCTRRSHFVLIYRNSKPPIVITPDEPEKFIEACQAEGYQVIG